MQHIRADYTDSINFYKTSSPDSLAAEFGTPLYVYSEEILRNRCRELTALSNHAGFKVNYSVKANSNPALLRIIRSEGLRADAMSPGELAMDFLAGYTPDEILYISNNNSREEMQAALDAKILISVDSLSQLEQLGSLQPRSKVMIRINPGIGEGHHAKVVTGGSASKFGISPRRLPEILAILEKYSLSLAGLNQHIGSLFMAPGKYLESARILLDIAAQLPPHLFQSLQILDFGGGFGIPYHKYEHEERLDLPSLANGLHSLISAWATAHSYSGAFLVEPGRYIAAECGVLLGTCTAVKQTPHNRFVGTDIGFNVLMRPMLYDSFHDVEIYGAAPRGEAMRQTIVGNICESGDILAKDRLLPPIMEGDIIGILDAGAYGFSMASNYNERFLPAEVLIPISGPPRLIRRRQTVADLTACLASLD